MRLIEETGRLDEYDKRIKDQKEGESMKGYESTKEDRKRWEREGYIAVACRLCGELMLFSKDYYTEQDLIGYECPYHTLNISLYKEESEI